MKKFYLGFLLTLFLLNSAHSQDTIKCCTLNINMDMASRYVWRGMLLSDAVNLQPMATLGWKNFSLGAWSSYALGKNYAEVDLSLGWQAKGLSLALNDYCTLQEPAGTSFRYFKYAKSATPHALESAISYQFQGKFPLKIMASSFFYGADKDSSGNNNYSSYIELSYPLQIASTGVNLIAGGTPAKGLYAEKAEFVNVGFSARREIAINNNYSIPFTFSLTANPASDYMYVVFIISL